MLLFLSHWLKVSRGFQSYEEFCHLKSREVRCGQVTQVVLGGSVSSGLLFHQRCSLDDQRSLIFLHRKTLQLFSVVINCIVKKYTDAGNLFGLDAAVEEA